jgi:hypothetical protein
MDPQESAFKAKCTMPYADKNLRCSERVSLKLRIRLLGISEGRQDFAEEGYTVDVSRHGASIAVDRQLRVGQKVKIERVGVGKGAQAQVVDHKATTSKGHIFGLSLADSEADLWNVAFPPETERQKAVLRILLRCIACGQLEVSYLNEFDSELFLAHHSVARLCGQCGGWTTWNQPYAHTPGEPDQSVEANSPERRSRYFLAPGTRNQRSFDRLPVDIVGCIRHPSFGIEVVLVNNLARGGLSFYSSSHYPESARLEMAIPYTSKAPNIYSLVRIVGCRPEGKHKDLTEYRAVYLT